MTTKTVDLYPSKDNFQRTNDREVPLQWAIGYQKALLDSIPESERATAVTSWPPKIAYTHVLTETEKLQEDLEAMRFKTTAIRALLPRDGALTAEQTDKLRQLLG